MPQPKKPTAMKLLHGSLKQKINKQEPKFSPGAVCPDWLHPLAKEEWQRIMDNFSDLGLVTAPDQSALAAYCQAYARWVQAEADVEKLGLLINEPIKSRYTGEVTGVRIKKNPAVTVAQQERQAMLTAGRLFGLNPAARSVLAVPEAEKPKKSTGKLTAADVFLPDDYNPQESIQ